MPTSFTPIYQISRNGADITGKFSDRCVSIRVDFASADGEGDSCMIILDDRDWAIERPNEGETISIRMGYAEVGLAEMGEYTIDEVIFSLSPKAITLKGTSTDPESKLKQHMIQHFEGKTLGELFQDMGKKAGISVQVHPDLQGTKVESKHMSGSPFQFVQDLSRNFGAIGKFVGGGLQVVPRDKGEDAEGNQMPAVILYPQHFGGANSLEVKHATKPAFGKARASYLDPDDYVTRFVEALSPGDDAAALPDFTINRKFATKSEAEAAAKSQMAALRRSMGEMTGTLSKGDPWLRDSMRVILRGFRDGMSGSYVADLVSHTYVKDQGILSQLHGKPPGDGEDYESLFDEASEQDQRRLYLDPGPGGLIGTVIDRVITNRKPTVGEIIDGADPLLDPTP